MTRIPPEVLWEDGLFLRPHHLQAYQSHFDSVASYLAVHRAFGYGVRTLKVREESIANWVFEITACDIVMPDGTIVIAGENAIVRPLEFRQMQFEEGRLDVWLAVPFVSSDAPNLVDEEVDGAEEAKASNRRYVAMSIERNDENTGDNLQPLKVRKLNARIFVGDRPAEGYATLKLAELKKVITDDELGRRYEISPDFVPASLTIESAPNLHAALRDMLDRLVAKHEDLLRPLRGNRAALFGDSIQTPKLLMQLQATNGVVPFLRQIAAQPGMHPFDVYLHMVRLAGDLAIVSDEWEPPELAVYDHDNPLAAFTDLRSKWLGMLETGVTQRVDFVEFKSSAIPGVLQASLPEHYFVEGVELFVGVESQASKDELATLFGAGRSLLGDPEDLPVLERARIPGIACDINAYIPPDLSSRKDRQFLRMTLEGDQWGRVCETKSIGIKGEIVETGAAKVFLYATNVDVSAAGAPATV